MKAKPKITDYLLILGIVVVLLVGIFLVSYYFNVQRNECLKDPFVYGSKQAEEKFNSEFYGFGILKVKGKNVPNLPALTFNSTESSWER